MESDDGAERLWTQAVHAEREGFFLFKIKEWWKVNAAQKSRGRTLRTQIERVFFVVNSVGFRSSDTVVKTYYVFDIATPS